MANGRPRSELILLEYHTQGKFSTNETRDQAGAYGISPNWTPSLVLNGLLGENRMIGPQSYEAYQEKLDALSGRSSKISITANVTATGFMNASVELKNLDTNAITGAKLYAVVYEDAKEDEAHYLVTDITPSQDVSLAGGQSIKFQLQTIKQNSTARHMVIILKSTDGQVIQALFAK